MHNCFALFSFKRHDLSRRLHVPEFYDLSVSNFLISSLNTHFLRISVSGSYWVVAPDLKGFGDSEKPFLATNYKDDVILEVNPLLKSMLVKILQK